MFSDFHVHTDFSGDCNTPARDQIQQAIALGMKELCITDHHDYDTPFSNIDFTLDIPSYVPYIKKLQQEYLPQIRICVGIELGLQTHLKDYLEKLVQSYPFDFIVGSNHFIDGRDPYYPDFYSGRSEEDAYRHYFEVTLKRIQTLDCFDVLGHLDYIVRYGPTTNHNYSFHRYQEWIDPILKLLIEKGKGLECNTAGFKYGLGHPNPSEDILTRYRELGGEILTIGSDSHATPYIGYCFEQVKPLLEQCGFRYYTIFHTRKPEFISI